MGENKSKSVIFLIILLVIFLALGGFTFYLLQQEKAKSLAFSEEIEVIRTKLKVTQAELKDSKDKVTRLESNISETQLRIDTLMSDLENEKAAKQEALVQASQLNASLEEHNTLKLNIEKKLSDSDETIKAMEERIKEMEGELKELGEKKAMLENKVKIFEEKYGSVELGKIVVSSEAAVPSATTSAAATKIKGKVLVVNKDYNFAIINLGIKDGVAIGNVFSVYHNNKNVGDIKIERVQDSMSAAGFMTMELRDKIVEGDRVELKS
jgi:predicted nuclease with TOPRIM domain